MTPRRIWLSLAVAAGLAAFQSGCGGGGSDDPTVADVSSPVGGSGVGNAVGVAVDVTATPVENVPPKPGRGPGQFQAQAQAGGQAPPAAPPAAAPSQGATGTDELLALAESSTPATPDQTGGAPAGSSVPTAPGFAGPGGRPGGFPGASAGGPPAGYPGASGGQSGFAGASSGPPAGYPGASGGQSGVSGAPGGPPAGYPGTSGGQSGVSGAAFAQGGSGRPGPGPGGMNAQMIGADVAGRAALRNSGAGGAPGFPGQPQGFAQGGPPGFPGQAGGAPTGFGAPGAGSTKAPDYTEPIAAAESFLAALESKDTQLLAEAVAIRGQYEAKGDAKQQMFRALKEENLPQEDLDALVRAFDGMEVRSKNTPKSSGRVGVIVGKQDDNKLLTRTLYVRREKEGWKILDFSGPRSENTGLSTKSKRGEGY